MAMQERCVCGHLPERHPETYTRFCWTNGCPCRTYRPIVARVAPNLWGELQALPDDSGEVA